MQTKSRNKLRMRLHRLERLGFSQNEYVILRKEKNYLGWQKIKVSNFCVFESHCVWDPTKKGQTLGQWDNQPSDPAYHIIEDCRISILILFCFIKPCRHSSTLPLARMDWLDNPCSSCLLLHFRRNLQDHFENENKFNNIPRWGIIARFFRKQIHNKVFFREKSTLKVNLLCWLIRTYKLFTMVCQSENLIWCLNWSLHAAQRWVFPVFYYGSNKSTGKETGKSHLCALVQ